MGKNILKYIPEDVSFTIIGISSHENDYRVCWTLNEHLGCGLTQTDSLLFAPDKEFTCFEGVYDEASIFLISNRCDNGFLLDKYKNFDYLLRFDSTLSAEELSEWLQNLKKTPLIAAVIHIPANKQVVEKFISNS